MANKFRPQMYKAQQVFTLKPTPGKAWGFYGVLESAPKAMNVTTKLWGCAPN